MPRSSATRERVLALSLQVPAMTPAEIAAAVGVHISGVQRHQRALAKEGRLVRLADRSYAAPGTERAGEGIPSGPLTAVERRAAIMALYEALPVPPTQPALAQRFGVSQTTIQADLRLLQTAGALMRRPGRARHALAPSGEPWTDPGADRPASNRVNTPPRG